MLPKQIKEGPVLVCNACGHVQEGAKLEEYKVIKKAEPGEEITVVEKESKPALPTTRIRCPECGHGASYWWLQQTRGADEPTTRFYRCTKCDHTWREYT
jgi:DNA-directed RNA polymerase subunit M